MRLPMLEDVRAQRTVVSSFGGYNHTPGVKENQFFDMVNMSSDEFPLLSPRKPYVHVRNVGYPEALYAHNKLCWIADNGFYYDGVRYGNAPDSSQLVGMGAYVTVWRDKAIFNSSSNTYRQLESQRSVTDVVKKVSDNLSFALTNLTQDPWYPDEEQRNHYQPFQAGEVVEISYFDLVEVDDPGGTPWMTVIRQYEWVKILNVQTEEDSGLSEYVETEMNQSFWERYQELQDILDTGKGEAYGFTDIDVRLSRKVPDMDFVCEWNNRLWGCSSEKHELYASALGDPYNWNVFEGTSQDSYILTIGSTGEFTGICAYGGGLLLFKENCIHRLYGTSPSNYQLTTLVCDGVQKGCERSICERNGILYYVSQYGVCAYSGSYPTVISGDLGNVEYTEASAGVWQNKVYFCMKAAAHSCYPDEIKGEHWEILVFDAERGCWHKEDELHAVCFAAFENRLYFLNAENRSLYVAAADDTFPTSDKVHWFVRTGKQCSQLPDNKTVSKIQVKATVFSGARLCIELRYDSGERWEKYYEQISHRKMCYTIPIIPRRCDHFEIRISGTGEVLVHNLARELEQGSEL